MEPPMDLLIAKLILLYHLTWHDLNKAVNLHWSGGVPTPSSVADVFQVCCDNGFWFAAYRGALRSHSDDWLNVSIRGTSFSLLFSKLS